MNTPPDTPISSTRIAMTVGAVTAVLMLVIPMLPGLNRLAQLISLAVFAGGIYYGMKQFRIVTGGSISYMKAFVVGIQIAFYTSVVLAFITYMMAKIIDPSIIDTYLNAIEQTLQSMNMPSGIADTHMQQMRELISPGFLAFATIFSYCLVGVVIASICGLFFKNTGQPNYPTDPS